MEVNIFNETEEKLEEEINLMKDVLLHAKEKLDVLEATFNVIIVYNDYIHKLNREYRGIDRETDVISFALEDDDTFNPVPRILGDIYISIDKAREQSVSYHHSLKRELCFLGVHGFLHLMGYDHMNKEDEEVMFKLQDDILEEMNVTR